MKIVIFGLIAIAAISFSFSSGILDGEKQVKSSKVVWKGYKVLGSHEGTLNLTSGSLTFDNEILTGGEFVLDVTSISCTDLEGESKGQLEGHLKSDDFFSVEKFNESSIVISSSSKIPNGLSVFGILTIKGTSHPIDFKMLLKDSSWVSYLTFDRSKYNVRYGSGSFFENLGDKLILDSIKLETVLSFN
jgi:polyisoprenoid-binding protein YceI